MSIPDGSICEIHNLRDTARSTGRDESRDVSLQLCTASMTESISPWISDYLIGIAEEHGANLSSVPLALKNKKVQLVDVSKSRLHPNERIVTSSA